MVICKNITRRENKMAQENNNIKRGFWESCGLIIGYIRGLFLSFWLDSFSLISSVGPTKIIKKNGLIKVGKRTRLWPQVKLSCVGNSKEAKAEILIGQFCSIGDNTQIHSGSRVSIGNRVLISWDVDIIGTDYHAPGGGAPQPEDIVIEDNVWIGCKVIILKGVTVGQGSIIAAGSIVTKDVPPRTLVAGNPAREIKTVESWNGR